MSSSSPKPLWIVRSSSIHQRGVFARSDIPKETPIIEYVGEKITKAESERRGVALMEKAAKTGGASVYIFTLNKKHDLDGGKSWNTARLINHSCDPNSEAFITRGRIWIYSKRDIKEGEELSFNYGFDLTTWEDHPCRCGSANCVGYIVDAQYWPKLKTLLKKREERRLKIEALEARAKELRQQMRDLEDDSEAVPAKPAKKTKTTKKKTVAGKKKAAKSSRKARA